MKLKPKQYAKILLKLLEDKPVQEVKSLISSFVKYLQANQALHFKEQILREFSRSYNKLHNIATVKVQSAAALPSDAKHDLHSNLGKLLAKKIELVDEVEPELLGGLVLIWEDNVIDSSLRAKINNLKNNLK